MLPLVLLHGALGASTQFANLATILSDKFDIHTLDFEGHGSRSSLSVNPFRIEYFAENVIHYLDKSSIDKCDIIGYSMGGYVALHLASLMPERVNRIFTLATKFRWDPETSAKEAGFLDAEKIELKVPKYAQFLQSLHGEEWRENLNATREMMIHLGDNPVLSSSVLSGVQNRVRIGLGDRDAMVSIEETVEAYKALPNGELQVFPNTPHPLEKVNVDIFADAIVQFFM
ncbi:MAG: alpha/beta fold hydrolase [Ignavibacteriae bacterium]|nr:alpha/beta fold hydrolase [Ignavibacteriota bacterium]